MTRYIAALDQGTTSTRCMLFDHAGKVIAQDQKEHRQIFPQPGWVEHDALEIWTRTQEVIAGALAKARVLSADLAAVGITNQRETTVVWDKATGQPIHNALVWQDTRTADICAALARAGGQDRFRARTGLPLATYFSGPKIRWLLDHVPGARARAQRSPCAIDAEPSSTMRCKRAPSVPPASGVRQIAGSVKASASSTSTPMRSASSSRY